MITVRVATVGGDLDLEARLASAIAKRRDAELLLRCVDRIELLAAIRGAGLDALVVAGQPSWLDHQSVSEAATRGVRIVGVSDGEAPLGASAVLGSDASVDEILEACRNASPANPSLPQVGGKGRLTTVWGPKGAPGRTRVAIELAFEIQSTQATCALIDADPYGGDVLQSLGIVEEMPTVVWAARAAGRGELSDAQIEQYLRRVEDGPIIIPGIPRSELWADVSLFGFKALLDSFRGLVDHTVIDVGFSLDTDIPTLDTTDGRNRMTIAAIRESDRVVAVLRADPLGLKNFLWGFEGLAALVDDDRIVIVANRVRDGQERQIAEIVRKHTGRRPAAYLPDVPSLAESAIELGGRIAADKGAAGYSAAIQSLAISTGARLQPKGVLIKLGGRKR